MSGGFVSVTWLVSDRQPLFEQKYTMSRIFIMIIYDKSNYLIKNNNMYTVYV